MLRQFVNSQALVSTLAFTLVFLSSTFALADEAPINNPVVTQSAVEQTEKGSIAEETNQTVSNTNNEVPVVTPVDEEHSSTDGDKEQLPINDSIEQSSQGTGQVPDGSIDKPVDYTPQKPIEEQPKEDVKVETWIKLTSVEGIQPEAEMSFTLDGQEIGAISKGQITKAIPIPETSKDRIKASILNGVRLVGANITFDACVITAEEAPTIMINGPAALNMDVGEVYIEQGATVIDAQDGELFSKITVNGNVDANTPGQYTIIYSVSNSFGKTSVAYRTITVMEVKKVQIPEVKDEGIDPTEEVKTDEDPAKETEAGKKESSGATDQSSIEQPDKTIQNKDDAKDEGTSVVTPLDQKEETGVPSKPVNTTEQGKLSEIVDQSEGNVKDNEFSDATLPDQNQDPEALADPIENTETGNPSNPVDRSDEICDPSGGSSDATPGDTVTDSETSGVNPASLSGESVNPGFSEENVIL